MFFGSKELYRGYKSNRMNTVFVLRTCVKLAQIQFLFTNSFTINVGVNFMNGNSQVNICLTWFAGEECILIVKRCGHNKMTNTVKHIWEVITQKALINKNIVHNGVLTQMDRLNKIHIIIHLLSSYGKSK